MKRPELRVIARRIAIEGALAAAGFLLALSSLRQELIAGLLLLLYGGRLVVAADRAQRVYYLGYGAVWMLADIVFVRTGVFRYAEASFLGPPLYMPLVFGQLAVLVGESVGWLTLRPEPRLPVMVDLGLLGAATGALILWHARPPAGLLIAFTAALLLRAALNRFDRRALAVALVFGVGEPVLEALLIQRGLFSFARPGPLGPPAWYWSFFAFASYSVTRAFVAGTARLRPPPSAR